MKKILFVLIVLMSIPTLTSAQKSRGGSSPSSSSSLRADRQIGITTNAGIKTMTGFGIIGSYYATPNIAADLGLGISLRGLRTGIRGRYLFSEKNFTPIVGAGLIYQAGTLEYDAEQLFLSVWEPGTEPTNPTNDIEIKPALYGQLITGFEYMTDGGFLLGLTAGYRIGFKDVVDGDFFDETYPDITQQEKDDLSDALNVLFGNGISIALNLGYAF